MYPVKIGLITLDRRMTLAQARRYGAKVMPKDLKRAGFDVLVSLTDPEIHGGTWIRINFAKKIGW